MVHEKAQKAQLHQSRVENIATTVVPKLAPFAGAIKGMSVGWMVGQGVHDTAKCYNLPGS